MKTPRRISLLLFIVAGFLFSCKSGSGPFAKGNPVAAKCTDGSFYLATIVSDSSGTYKVDYDSGETGEVPATDLKALCASPENVKTGDAVVASWNSSVKLYAGIVQEIQRNGVLVKWDDGSAPSLCPFGKFAK